MADGRALVAAFRAIVCLAGLLAGCAALPPNSFLDPTAVGQFPADYRVTEIRRVLTPRDTPPGIANATDPTPADLVPSYEEYRIGTADQVALLIDDLLAQGLQETVVREVSPTGYIRVPRLGSVKVDGLTEADLEQEITAQLKEADILPDAIVRAFVQVKRQRVFSIIGGVNQPGPYAITEPNLRLLDAIGMARDVSPTIGKLYVIRREETAPRPPAVETPPDRRLIIEPPTEEEPQSYQGSLFAAVDLSQDTRPSTPPQELRPEELESIIAPKGRGVPPATQAQPQEPPARRFPPLVFQPETDEPVEAWPEKQKREEPARPVERAQPAPPARRPFDWEEVPEYELTQRVIEIDVNALKAGDPRYNIVLRDRDTINVPEDTGVFYMMGEVNRPGVYGFGNRDITLKQAIATTGGLAQLAWPARCEIIRREPGTDTQVTIPINLDAIFAGLEKDVYLRDNDILNVGTHVAAPFLFVIRNSFRFTYGFGFVYDRNFADQDSIAGRQNPETLRRENRQRRGLPF